MKDIKGDSFQQPPIVLLKKIMHLPGVLGSGGSNVYVLPNTAILHALTETASRDFWGTRRDKLNRWIEKDELENSDDYFIKFLWLLDIIFLVFAVTVNESAG